MTFGVLAGGLVEIIFLTWFLVISIVVISFMIQAMEAIKCTIQLVFLPAFRVTPMGIYFNMLPLVRLETR